MRDERDWDRLHLFVLTPVLSEENDFVNNSGVDFG